MHYRLGNGGGTGRGGSAIFIAGRFTTGLRTFTGRGAGGLFKFKGARGGGGGAGSCALASANANEAITATKNTFIAFIIN
ncbi:MAG: hypothetical protein EOP47_04265 [Sphingobacteriaceae bacterium]|nr:MAG: hypothetical protein EOP47_04265 [Sphingobacteriaceae bacterium]